MSLPVIYMDVAFLSAILLASLVIGALLGWLVVGRRRVPAPSASRGQRPSETRLLPEPCPVS